METQLAKSHEGLWEFWIGLMLNECESWDMILNRRVELMRIKILTVSLISAVMFVTSNLLCINFHPFKAGIIVPFSLQLWKLNELIFENI